MNSMKHAVFDNTEGNVILMGYISGVRVSRENMVIEKQDHIVHHVH